MGVSKGISKRVPVMVDGEQHSEVKKFSDKTGVPIARVVRDAIKSYMEVQAAARLERLDEIHAVQNAKVVCIDANGKPEPLWDNGNVIIPPAS